MKKSLLVGLFASAFAFAQADDLKILSVEDGFPTIYQPQLQALGISADGKYACGACSWGAGVFVADLESGLVKWDQIYDDDGGELRHVDNYGVAVGLSHTFEFDTGELSLNDVPDGYSKVLYEDLTNDGSLVVGSLCGSFNGTRASYLKKGGEWKMLPYPPDDELHGLAHKLQEMSAAKCVSGDGSVIFGFLGSFSIPVLWYRNDAGEYEYDFFVSRFLKLSTDDLADDSKPLYGLSGQYLNMSNNGRYVSFLGIIEDEEGHDMYIPVVYDTAEKKAILYSEKQAIDESGAGLYPTAVSDDGTVIGCIGQPYFGSFGSFIMKAGETQAELFTEAFPKYDELLGMSDYLGFSIPTAISADGGKIVGYTFYAEDYDDTDEPAFYVTYVISTGDTTGADAVSATVSHPDAVYSIDGRRLRSTAKGLNIIRNADGTVTKVMK